MGKNRWEQEAEQFRKDCERAGELSQENLQKLMRDNQDTEYGRAHHFAEVETAEDYRRLVPLTDYSDYAVSVERMRAGEGNVLTACPIQHFVMTSGSTGYQKWIPLTDEALSRALIPLWYACHGKTPGIDAGRHLVLSVFRIDPAKPEPETLLSCALYRALHKQWTKDFHRRILGGEELLFSREISDIPYVKLWIALSSPDMTGIQAIFLYDALLFFRYFEEHWENVLFEVQNRCIPENLHIGAKERHTLLALPSPDDAWFSHVRRECRAGFSGIMKRIWPDFQWISGIGDSAFAVQEKLLRDYLGETPIHYFSYTSSECFIGIAMEPDRREYVMIPQSGYFEFLPADDENAQPRTLSELDIGEKYELIVTNFSGLYRYRLGDVVEVSGFCGQSPVIRVCGRKNQAINVAGEKTDMRLLSRAMEEFRARSGLRISEYSVCDDKTLLPGRYQCFIETAGEDSAYGRRNVSGYGGLLDEILRELSEDYRDLRGIGMIGKAQVYRVEQGTHLACRRRFQKKEAHSKPLQYLSDPEVIAYMRERTL